MDRVTGAIGLGQTSVGTRAAGYVIDVLPAALAMLAVGWIPIIGAIIGGVILGSYWLLRDVAGASVGKLILGTEVTTLDGRRAGVGRRVLRNLPIAAGPSLLVIPVLGYAVAPVVAGLLILAEVLVIVLTGRRIGDRLAGTTVMPKSP